MEARQGQSLGQAAWVSAALLDASLPNAYTILVSFIAYTSALTALKKGSYERLRQRTIVHTQASGIRHGTSN